MPSSVLSVPSVSGKKIIDSSGAAVIPRGYNIGGWMNMENFITGYPGTESQRRRVLRQALGPELYAARELADSFMLARCAVREKLAGVLSASARQPA